MRASSSSSFTPAAASQSSRDAEDDRRLASQANLINQRTGIVASASSSSSTRQSSHAPRAGSTQIQSTQDHRQQGNSAIAQPQYRDNRRIGNDDRRVPNGGGQQQQYQQVADDRTMRGLEQAVYGGKATHNNTISAPSPSSSQSRAPTITMISNQRVNTPSSSAPSNRPSSKSSSAAAAEQLVEHSLIGVVTNEMIGQYRPSNSVGNRRRISLADSLAQGRSEAYGGKIKRTRTLDAADASSPIVDEVYEFSERDLISPNTLLFVGDIISFSVFVESKSQRRGATQVALVECNPIGRQRGRIVNLRENFGFIAIEEPIDDDDDDAPQHQPHRSHSSHDPRHSHSAPQLFFHFSELIDPTRMPALGDELSFVLGDAANAADGAHKSAALRIAVLPAGSMHGRETAKQQSTGVITKEISYEAATASSSNGDASTTESTSSSSPSNLATRDSSSSSASASSPSSSRASRPKVIPGLISYTDASGAVCSLTFRPADLPIDRRHSTVVLRGDTVHFYVMTLNNSAGKSHRATKITINHAGWTKIGREQGIVATVKEGFGFIDSATRTEKVFLHISQLRDTPQSSSSAASSTSTDARRDSAAKLVVGMEVEYNIVCDAAAGRNSAIRAVALPPGTVTFEEVLAYTFTGKISRGMKVKPPTAVAKPDDASSSGFSKNDLRRDQHAGRSEYDRGGVVDKVEKGEVRFVSASGDNMPPIEFKVPREGLSFVSDDVLPPVAANLDTSSFIVGDIVSLSLRQHKQTRKYSATNVQLEQMNPEGREQGQVSRIKSESGVGYMMSTSRLQSIKFALKDVEPGVQVGDAFEFNINESPASVNKDRQSGGGASRDAEPTKLVAVRITSLPAGSVQIESVDRSQRLRGVISSMPESVRKPKSSSSSSSDNRSTASTQKNGYVTLMRADVSQTMSTTLASIRTHPASWGLAASAASAASSVSAVAAYDPALVHPASLLSESKSAQDDRYAFSIDDVDDLSLWAKGDALTFFVCTRSKPASSRRAVEFQHVPVQGIVDRIDMVAGAGGYTGTITVTNASGGAHHTEEVFTFNSKDVTINNSSDSASSSSSAVSPAPSPSPSPSSSELAVGDTVEFGCVGHNQDKSSKRRHAIKIRRIREAAKSEVRPGVRRKPGTAIVSASRFARGPDAVGIGFAPRVSRDAGAALAE